MSRKEALQIAGLQCFLQWEKPEENRKFMESALEKMTKKVDLVLLPEMFSTGFSMKPQHLAESMSGASIDWMRKMAAKHAICLSGSLIIEENGRYYNRLIWMQADGNFSYYDKRHLFSLAGEEKVYNRGAKRPIWELKGWRIFPQICYDLRFPVWNRNDQQYDLMFFVANWPERRADAWQSLLKARSIENQAYVFGLNRVGDDGNGVYHNGLSACYDPLGEVVAALTPGESGWVYATLESQKIDEIRGKFRFLEDGDDFEIEM